jgi:hypothetical protein
MSIRETATEKGCRQILDEIVSNGKILNCSLKDLEKAIIRFRGADQRTIRNWKKALVALEFLSQKNKLVYEINLSQCSEVAKEKAYIENKQKRLLP